MQQMTFDPIWPKAGSAKSSVLHFLMGRPEGSCRRDFATIDCFEVSARIGELESDGWQIKKQRCDRHRHKHRFVSYSL